MFGTSELESKLNQLSAGYLDVAEKIVSKRLASRNKSKSEESLESFLNNCKVNERPRKNEDKERRKLEDSISAIYINSRVYIPEFNISRYAISANVEKDLAFLNKNTPTGARPPPKKHTRHSKHVKAYLEQIYLRKPKPNSAEREYIAGRCGLNPKQVRIWRARMPNKSLGDAPK